MKENAKAALAAGLFDSDGGDDGDNNNNDDKKKKTMRLARRF